MECLNLYIYTIYIEHVIMKYTVHLLYLDLLKLLLERSNNGLGRLLMHLDMMVTFQTTWICHLLPVGSLALRLRFGA